MKRILFVVLVLVFSFTVSAQAVGTSIAASFHRFESDPQLKSAIASLYIVEAKSGKVVFEKNASVGLAPASTLKVITSVTAYEVLGKDFRYETALGYDGAVSNSELKGNVYIRGYGDPTLGSWRWGNTKDTYIFDIWLKAIKEAGIKKIDGALLLYPSNFSMQAIPDGWIWQDIGNYYGAGAFVLNWKENQYDLKLNSGATLGSKVEPANDDHNYYSEIESAAKESGDNAYIYLPIGNAKPVLTGTIPVNKKGFTISGAMPDPIQTLFTDFKSYLSSKNIQSLSAERHNKDRVGKPAAFKLLSNHYSPSLDSIIYWLNKKSINLYAEALVKTMAVQKSKNGATNAGVGLIKDFWKSKGLDAVELNMVDGSGLSPLNRVTTKAQVFVLQYAQKQAWYGGLYHSLPEFNGMKMKSGTINGVKAFAGYYTSKSGSYIFSFIVNNYNGSSATLVQKMYQVLNELK